MSLTAEFTQAQAGRRYHPTPAGALPTARRSRRGMVDLANWDRRVQEDNAANGTTSDTTPPLPSDERPAGKPESTSYPTGNAAPGPEMSREAIMESDTPPAPPVNVPTPTKAAIAAAKRALQADGEFVPPPPTDKTKPKAPK